MIVTIDGPAGAGKSSTAKALAQRLGFRFLDTGATYRAVAWAALDRGHDWSQPQRLVDLATNLRIELVGQQVLVDGQDVSDAIRTMEVTTVTHYAADNPGVREVLVRLQQQLAGQDDIVTEGRDQATVVFPKAECKIYLTAAAEERARRRLEELQARGEATTLPEVLQKQEQRDHRDSTRAVGPLLKADDAIEVNTDGLTPAEVVDKLEALVRSRIEEMRRSGSGG